MSLTLPVPQLLDLVRRLTSEDYTVNWLGDPQAFVAPVMGGPGVHLELSIRGNGAVGVDETRHTDTTVNGVPTQIVETCGLRHFILAVKVSSLNWQHASWDILERLRTRIRSAVSRIELQEAGLSFVSAGVVQPLGGTWDNRAADVGYLELTFAWAVSDVQTDNDGGVILTVNGDDTVPGP